MHEYPSRAFVRPKPTREQMAARIDTVRNRLSEGAAVREIAAELDVDRAAVYRIINNNPDLEINRKTDPVSLCGTLGGIRAALEGQHPEFLAWVASSKPEGVSVAEFLVSCAVDVYHEDSESDSSATE